MKKFISIPLTVSDRARSILNRILSCLEAFTQSKQSFSNTMRGIASRTRSGITLSILIPSLLLAGCASSGPLTEKQQAAKYGMTVERYREEKVAAARMNMSFDEHIKMIMEEDSMDSGMNMEGHNMDDM